MNRLDRVAADRVSRRVSPRPLLSVLVALLALAPALAAARSLPADAASPTVGHAAVVAHGVASLTGEDLAWRLASLSRDPAEGVGEAVAPLGFLLADAGTLLVGDRSGDKRARLAAGEAVFLQDDQELALAALGDDQADFYEFALVPAGEAADAGSGDVVHTGRPFPAAGGDLDLDLVRATLATGEATTLPEGSGPTLVLATNGTVAILPEDGTDSTTLAAGEAGSFAGAIAVRAEDGEATFVAALVGPEVIAPAALAPIAFSALATDAPDQDRDRLNDADEADRGTDPTNPDSDGDGTLDDADVDPLDPATS